MRTFQVSVVLSGRRQRSFLEVAVQARSADEAFDQAILAIGQRGYSYDEIATMSTKGAS